MNSIDLRSPLAVMLLAGLFAGCENPVSHEDHTEPEGIVIRAGTTELVRVDDAGVTGSIDVAVGAQTPELTVTFIDHDGDDITLDEHEYSIDVESTDSATATWQGTLAEGFTGRVTGHEAGSTTLEFHLFHGHEGEGHQDGDAYVVPVTVAATQL